MLVALAWFESGPWCSWDHDVRFLRLYLILYLSLASALGRNPGVGGIGVSH